MGNPVSKSVRFTAIWIKKNSEIIGLVDYECGTFEAEWRIQASINIAIIASVNGLSPVRHQAIFWNNADLLPIEPVVKELSQMHIKHNPKIL